MTPPKGRIPKIMDEPHRLRAGEHWDHRCPANTPLKPCSTAAGIQGGEPGLRAHLRTVHPEFHLHVKCDEPCPVDILA